MSRVLLVAGLLSLAVACSSGGGGTPTTPTMATFSANSAICSSTWAGKTW